MSLPRALAIAVWLIAVAASPRVTASEPTLAEEAAFRAAVDRVAGAVVRIEPVATTAAVAAVVEAGIGFSPSTGLVVDPAGLVLATSFAVPPDARETVLVLPDGRRVGGRPLGRDTARGVVLLETPPIPDAPRIEPVSRKSLAPGQWTIAVGRGWTATRPGMAVGILSAVDRGFGLAVQTDASVSPMNYGGPLIDIAGRVIGIVAPLPAEPARLMRGTELYDAGIGFAVPLEDLLAELPRLRAGETLEPGLLGIGYRSRDAINGAPVIASVRQGAPAARAGLRPGDRITSIGGRPVRRIADARHALVPRHAGDAVEITIERSGPDAADEVRSTATLVAALPPWRRAILGVVVADQPSASGGAEANAAAAAPIAASGREQPQAVRIDWVLPGGPAESAGLTAGDAIATVAPAGDASVAAVPTPTVAALAGALAGYEPGDSVRLSITRGGTISGTAIRLAEMPCDVPPEGPPAAAMADGTADAARVVRVKAADLAVAPLAVLPSGTEPVPLVVWCGLPRGRVDERDAAVWKAAVASAGVAVMLPNSAQPREWTRDDVAPVLRGLQAIAGEREVDSARVAVAGEQSGGRFAWMLAEALGVACSGVAVFDAELPRRFAIDESTPGASRWVLFGGATAGDEAAADGRGRLVRAGHTVGTIAAGAGGGPPTAVICRWASLLGLL